MTDMYYDRLCNLIRIVKKDKERTDSHYFQGIMLGIRLAIRAYYWTYPDEPSTQFCLYGMNKIKKEIEKNEN